MSLLNPFDDWSEEVWQWVEELDRVISQAIQNPAEMMGGSDFAESLFSQIWPLSAMLAWLFALMLATAVIFLYYRGAKHLPLAFMAMIITGTAGSGIWLINQRALEVQRRLSEGVSQIGASTLPAGVADTPPFPYAGRGLLPMLLYMFEVLWLAVLLVVVLLLVFGAIVMGSMIILSIGLLPLGGFGRNAFRLAFIFWLITFIVGLPTVALMRRVGQIIAYNIAAPTDSEPGQQVVATVGGFAVVTLAIASPWLWYMLAKFVRSMLGGGHSDANVSGGVDANVDNRAEVDVTSINNYGDSMQALDVRVVEDASDVGRSGGNQEESPGVVHRIAGGVEAAGIVLGQPEVVATAHAVKLKTDSKPTS